MIQISRATNFTNAEARARRERMLVTPAGFRRYYVTNRSNGHRYEVFFSQLNGKKFGVCNCEAGSPTRGDRAPMICKHLYVSVLVHTSLMRQRMSH